VDVIDRRTLLEFTRGTDRYGPARFHGWLRDRVERSGASTDATSLSITGDADASATFAAIEIAPLPTAELGDLVGQSAVKGLRRRLDPLAAGPAGDQALRRLLWDLPVALMVSGQSFLVDHPSLEAPTSGIPTAGVDQCSGWRAGGEMLTLIDRSHGVLRMQLSDELVGDDHLGDEAPGTLVPMATRRRRRLTVAIDDGRLAIRDHHRDSYADPDGVERGLHHWIVEASARAEDHLIESIEVSSRALPWLECPSAAHSAQRLVGLALEDVEGVVGVDFTGIATCTHLNDTLVALSSVPEMLRLVDP
jgi:hypothetical protein